MVEHTVKPDMGNLTSVQIGAIGESVVAVGLMQATGGRLTPFEPFADDDGIDLLIYDKVTRRALPLQVKTRTKFDNEKAQTVQFDVQRSTFTDQGGTHLLAVLLDGTEFVCSWLVPMNDLQAVARSNATKYTIVPSAKETSKDRNSPFRHTSFEDVARTLIETMNG